MSLIAACKLGISRSMGIMASTPYTNWKGVNPVEDLTAVNYVHGAENNIWCQLFLWFLSIYCNIILNTLLTTST